MEIETFKVEKWMNKYEKGAVWDLAQTCVNTLSLEELFSISNTNKSEFFNRLSSKKLGYGHITGSPEFKEGICKFYETLSPSSIIPTIGAAGANHLVFYSLINPGDSVVSVLPTYQQLYSIPASFGANMKLLRLKKENTFLPDVEELKKLVNEDTKLICINNPNNPCGSLADEKLLEKIVETARDANAYLLCDEVYRGLNQEDIKTPSIADIYENGISTMSMSKVFSLAGLRLGWVASKNEEVIQECLKHREYNMISCSLLDEEIAALALKNADVIVERNKKIIRENLKILDEWVKNNPHFSYVKPKGGTTALLFFNFDVSSEEFCAQIHKEKGVFLTPGFCFEENKCFRIGYAGESDVLINGLAKISDFCNDFLTIGCI